MSALAEKPDTAIAQVHTRSHPIPIGRRSDHLGSAVQRNSAEAPERIRDDLGLNLALALIGDVREDRTAARPLGRAGNAIGRWLQDLLRGRPYGAALHLFELDLHDLSRDCAGHEHDSAFVARDHAPASGGPFNRQLVALASDHLQKSVSAN